jgi:hypothetical protein
VVRKFQLDGFSTIKSEDKGFDGKLQSNFATGEAPVLGRR